MQGIVGVFEYSGTIAEVMASLAWLARFLIEANWSRVKIAVKSVRKFVDCGAPAREARAAGHHGLENEINYPSEKIW